MKVTAPFSLSRRQFVVGTAALFSAGAMSFLAGCTPGTDSPASETEGSQDDSPAETASTPATQKISMVWLPDTSSTEFSVARDAWAAEIMAACGLECEMVLTTDYNVAIEAIASGKANMSSLGAEGYIQANKKNSSVQCSFIHSDAEGGIDGACYYSRIAVPTEKAGDFKDSSGKFSLDSLEGGTFSFVSATSTSGFKVPAAGIVNHFGLASSDDLTEAGKFFSEVLFGGSHQGSLFNLVSGDADAAAFCDTDTDMFLTLVSGAENEVGAVYEVRDNAEAPFDTLRGQQFTIIDVTPVLNAPYSFNHDAIDDETRKKIVAHFCSDTVANNPQIFYDPDDENAKGLVKRTSDKMRFVEVTDSWYDPIRKISS
ncbi:MAG: phosphate/phosphite/phosphonate ABC transporter substrate-binding protein [Eggerthellaceae bacterium]|jgi:phosphonate transport system substrate-binding protein|nr:phosphate/phosphite/phosphonate ABC transporter substrate-binding protein [Eggerthellaceae bacterium]MDR2715488.1 phosphate/phosphite/phosphonate ABC transporter substrate-binding protein [Coriobacteriaceae bacterium]